MRVAIIPIIKQMRIKSWLKNIFVFIPSVFALKLFDINVFTASLLAFIAFCLVSSAVYTINDIRDADVDRMRPAKRGRPIASGALNIKSAWILAAVFTLAAFGIAYYINILALLVVIIYFAVNILYSFQLKHIPIIDVFCIAAGFVLRLYCGGAATSIAISDWLFLTVVSMSLFMAFGKRRGEMTESDAAGRRPVLEHYDLGFLNGMIFVLAGLSMMFYALWAIERGLNMVYTVPVLIFIVCKYLLLIHGGRSSGDPVTIVFSSKSLLVTICMFAILAVALLYSGL